LGIPLRLIIMHAPAPAAPQHQLRPSISTSISCAADQQLAPRQHLQCRASGTGTAKQAHQRRAHSALPIQLLPQVPAADVST
jgi:hypothetical protein